MGPRAAAEQRPLSFVAAAAWTLGMVLVVEVAGSVTELARPGAGLDLVSVTMCHVLGYSAVVLAMLRVYAPDARVRDVLAFRPAPLAYLVFAVVIGASLYPAASWVDALVARRFPSRPEELDALGRLMATPTAGRRAFLGAAFVLIMPAFEEVFFRGVLFGRLRRVGPDGATRTPGMVVLATAVYFAIAHGDPRSFASVLALGAMLGWLRDRARSVVPTILAQAAFFAVPVVPILRGGDPMADESYGRAITLGGLAVAALAAAALEWMSRARVARALREESAEGDAEGEA